MKVAQMAKMHREGFEPSSVATSHLECDSLDRSDICAAQTPPFPQTYLNFCLNPPPFKMSFDNFKNKRKSNAWDSQSLMSVGEEALEVSPERVELFAAYTQQSLQVVNRSSGKLYFRVVASHPTCYEISPAQDILSPGQTAQLLIRALSQPSPSHSFSLQWAAISDHQLQTHSTPVPTHTRTLPVTPSPATSRSSSELQSLLRVPILVSVAAVSFLVGFVTA